MSNYYYYYTIIISKNSGDIDDKIKWKISKFSKCKYVITMIINGFRYKSNRYAKPNVTIANITVTIIIIRTFCICPI